MTECSRENKMRIYKGAWGGGPAWGENDTRKESEGRECMRRYIDKPDERSIE